MKKEQTFLWVLGLLALLVLLAAPFVGMETIWPASLWNAPASPEAEIFWRIRFPRVLAAFLAGAALAGSGAALQAVFRNPLAEPFTLGVSSGAALGAALAMYLTLPPSLVFWAVGTNWNIPTLPWCALVGAWVAIVLVYGLTRLRTGFSSTALLLAGVAVSYFFSSMVLFLQYLSDPTRTFHMIRWVMGGLDRIVGYDDLLSMAPFAVGGLLLILLRRHELDLLLTGEELAIARGVEVVRVKQILFLAASLLVAGVVAICGPIGFVGLIGPHICRLLVGPRHGRLLPASICFGGLFLVVADTLARTLLAPTELPVGILTALSGGPFFLWLLLRSNQPL
ncbi:MAG: iron ABC transporter permease [Thermoguttaceae bacterium]|nr:iron ABC transporter permease [Thermoguttaceae bacterium]MDW8038882.1 iron ABC transporter permease [Thermoguttaceae bacterium]